MTTENNAAPGGLTACREEFEQQRKAGQNVDWYTWQIAWHDAMFTHCDSAPKAAEQAPVADAARGEPPNFKYVTRAEFEQQYPSDNTIPAQQPARASEARDSQQLADWLLTDPQTGEPLHFAGPLESDFLRFSRVKMQSKSGAVWTLSARLEEGYLTATERLENIKRAAREDAND